VINVQPHNVKQACKPADHENKYVAILMFGTTQMTWSKVNYEM